MHDLDELIRQTLHKATDGYYPEQLGREQMLRHRLGRRRALRAIGSLALTLSLALGLPLLVRSLPHMTSPLQSSPIPSITASVPRTPSPTTKASVKPVQSASTLVPTTNPTKYPIVTVTYRNNGGTVVLRPGQRLQVVLSSTDWHFQNSSNPTGLRME